MITIDGILLYEYNKFLNKIGAKFSTRVSTLIKKDMEQNKRRLD